MKQRKCPSTIFVELTNACNFDCSFCPSRIMSRPKGMMDVSLFKKIVLESKDCGVEHFNLWIMGEPFLHPHFFELVKFAKENKIKLSLITNGSLLNNALIEQLLSLDLSNEDNLLISYLIPNACGFELRRAGQLKFDTYKNGIFTLIERKITQKAQLEIIIMYLINIFSDVIKVPGLITDAKGVLDSLRELAEFASRIKEKNGIKFNFAIPSEKKIKVAIQQCRELKLEFLPGVFFNLKWLTNWGKAILPEGLKVIPCEKGYCAYPFETLGVFWNGEITLCCDDYNAELIVGKLGQNSLPEVFYGEKAEKIRQGMEDGNLLIPRCQLCQGDVIDQQGKVLKSYYKKYYLARALRHLRSHGLKKTVKKFLAELKI